MITGKTFVRISLSSWFLALLPSLVVIWFLPEMAKEHSLVVESGSEHPFPILYADLNGDTVTERLMVGRSSHPYINMVAIQDNEGDWYDQWNLPGDYHLQMSPLFTGNYDHDGYGEVYIFTIKSDSVFLNVNEFFEEGGTLMTHHFVTRIKLFKNEVTSSLAMSGFFDQNGDGKDELYFGISTGYALEPRKLYFFDLVSRNLKSSEYTSIDVGTPQLQDLDGDERPEIFGQINASGNHHFKTPFSDYSSWLMIFDDQLQFKFPPIEYPGFGNSISVNAFNEGTRTGFLAVYGNGGAASTKGRSKLAVCAPDGAILKERLLSELGSPRHEEAIILKHPTLNRIVLLTNPMIVLDDNLGVLDKIPMPFHSNTYPYQADLDGDRANELLVYSDDEKKMAVYSADLNTFYGDIYVDVPYFRQFSTRVTQAGESHLFLYTTKGGIFIGTIRDPYYLLGYLVYPLIYFLFVGFILTIRKITTWQIAKKEDLKKRLLTMQLQSVKGQLDPHFTFNALNSVASLLYLDDRHTAYDALNKFTRLLRQMLNDADRIYRTLEEELEFVTGYLNLEKVRFGDKFNYAIDIGEGVTCKEKVPKMVLQTFAENAIKHGILPMKTGGWLKITIVKENGYLNLTIEDNGVGRKNASRNNGSLGKGLKVTSEFFQILNRMNSRTIRHELIDLHDSCGNPTGTRVEVNVPIDESVEV